MHVNWDSEVRFNFVNDPQTMTRYRVCKVYNMSPTFVWLCKSRYKSTCIYRHTIPSCIHINSYLGFYLYNIYTYIHHQYGDWQKHGKQYSLEKSHIFVNLRNSTAGQEFSVLYSARCTCLFVHIKSALSFKLKLQWPYFSLHRTKLQAMTGHSLSRWQWSNMSLYDSYWLIPSFIWQLITMAPILYTCTCTRLYLLINGNSF